MTDQHIASAFDRDLEKIQAQIMKMGGLVENAILEAAVSLEERDEERAEQVRRSDKAIDALEESINEEAARVIALRAPAAIDLRVVLSVMKVSGNLERIGDYAKNLAKRTRILAHMEPMNGSASSLIDRDIVVDQMYNALFREFLTFMMENPSNITSCMHLHFIAKNIERMGDHVTAIAEQVVYLVTGAMPDEEREKANTTV